jgi:iron transport multicopper oxidase
MHCRPSRYGPWPQILNWTTKAKGAMAGCVLTALFGLLSIIWYGWGNHDEEDIAEEIKRKQEIKQAKGGKFGAIKKLARSSAQ